MTKTSHKSWRVSPDTPLLLQSMNLGFGILWHLEMQWVEGEETLANRQSSHDYLPFNASDDVIQVQRSVRSILQAGNPEISSLRRIWNQIRPTQWSSPKANRHLFEIFPLQKSSLVVVESHYFPAPGVQKDGHWHLVSDFCHCCLCWSLRTISETCSHIGTHWDIHYISSSGKK